MKKLTAFLAAGVGAAMLTGCGPAVMGDRYYKNTDGAATAVPAANVSEPAEQKAVEVAPAPAPAQKDDFKAPEQKNTYRVYEPMQQTESDKIIGIDESVKASGKKSAATGKSRIYKVRRGDSPSRIAARHKVSLAALMQANNLTESDARKLRIGQTLVIPAGGVKAAAPAKKAKVVKSSKKSAAKVSKAALNSDGTYTVKSGDSPERIARKFKVKIADLLNANNLDESSSRKLQIGQKLIIPGGSVALSAAAENSGTANNNNEAAAVQQSAAAPAVDETAPVIPDNAAVPGDDLAKKMEAAAPAAGSTADEVSETGNIATHFISENEISLADFAVQQKTTVEELKRINKDPLPDVLHKNDMVYVPLN